MAIPPFIFTTYLSLSHVELFKIHKLWIKTLKGALKGKKSTWREPIPLTTPPPHTHPSNLHLQWI